VGGVEVWRARLRVGALQNGKVAVFEIWRKSARLTVRKYLDGAPVTHPMRWTGGDVSWIQL